MDTKWMKFCIGFSVIFLPFSIQCKTQAYSPSIPGQPLIFHHKKPTTIGFEQRIFEQLSKKHIHQLLEISNANIRLSEGLLGLIGTSFLPTDSDQKLGVGELYNKEIRSSISLIYDEFLKLDGPSSKKLAHLMKQTLTSFAKITNKMVRNSVNATSNTSFQNNYQQMQKVINHFNKGLDEILKDPANRSLLQAEAESALEGLVSTLSLYISNTNSLVNGGSAGPKNMVLARQQLIRNLTVFVEATFALQIVNFNKKCG